MRGVDQPKGWSLPFLFLVFDVEDNFFILYTYYPVEPYELPIIKFFQPVVTCESYVKGAFIKVSIWKVELAGTWRRSLRSRGRLWGWSCLLLGILRWEWECFSFVFLFFWLECVVVWENCCIFAVRKSCHLAVHGCYHNLRWCGFLYFIASILLLNMGTPHDFCHFLLSRI